MNNSADTMITAGWILVGIYVLITLYLVFQGARKIKSMSDYAVGNVVFKPWSVGLSLAAAMTSAATFIINPGFIAFYGVSAVISFGFVLPAAALTSLVILSKRFRKHGTTVKALTMAQWMGTMYKSKVYSFFFAVLSLLLLTFIVLILVGLTKVFAKTLQVSELNILIAMSIFIFGYMMFGGANSMVYTNTVQAIIMIVVAIIMLTSGYEFFKDGIGGFFTKLHTIDPQLTSFSNSKSFMFRDFFEIVISQLIIGVAIVCQPHIITKALLLKSDKDVNKYLVFGLSAQLLFFLVVITGLYARLVFPDLTYNGAALRLDGVIPAYVVQKFPVFVGLIVVLGLISAGISTIEGLIQSVSTTITSDIIKPIMEKFGKTIEDRSKTFITINKIVIVFMAVISAFISYDQLVNPKLSVGVFAQNGVYAYFSAAFVPILFGMFFPNVKLQVVFPASIAALITHFSMYYGKLPVPFTSATGENPGVAAAVAIIVSVITGSILYLASRKKS